MGSNLAKIDKAGTVPAPRSLQRPSWPEMLTEWVNANCIQLTWSGSGIVRSFRPPVTIPAEMRALVPEQVDRYRTALAPAPRRTILAMLARLSVHFPDQRSEAEWKILHEDYADALAEMPADIIAESIRLYLRKGRFYPKLSELIAAAELLCSDRAEELAQLVNLAGVETPEERSARIERERKEAEAKRLAEIEARCRARPYLRPYFKWANTFRRHMNAIAWLRWLEGQYEAHGPEALDRWHQQLGDEQTVSNWPDDFDAFARLRAIAATSVDGAR